MACEGKEKWYFFQSTEDLKGSRFGLKFSSTCFLFAFKTLGVSKSCLAFIHKSVGGQED